MQPQSHSHVGHHIEQAPGVESFRKTHNAGNTLHNLAGFTLVFPSYAGINKRAGVKEWITERREFNPNHVSILV
jgi:hypothetical protein